MLVKGEVPGRLRVRALRDSDKKGIQVQFKLSCVTYGNSAFHGALFCSKLSCLHPGALRFLMYRVIARFC